MKHLKYFKTNDEIKGLNITPLVYYVEDSNFLNFSNIPIIGKIENNLIFVDTDFLNSGEYTISFADNSGNELESWIPITKFTV